jgi:exopolyphosphatase/guanosine-5'-triphosphate,3'-diphosphate pyrophosphatase
LDQVDKDRKEEKVRKAAGIFGIIVFVGIALANIVMRDEIGEIAKEREARDAIKYKKRCVKGRYAFDIGSGRTRSTARLMDNCKKGKPVEFLGPFSHATHVQKCISASADGQTIEKECQERSVKAMKAVMADYGIDCLEEKCYGIATAWARNANNSNELIEAFKDIGVKVKIISQDEEGTLGFRAAKMHESVKDFTDQEVIVWDTGGGSFQLNRIRSNGELYVYNGPYGVFNMSQELEQHFAAHHKPETPFYDDDAVEEIMEYARCRIGEKIREDAYILEKLHDPSVRIVGIGGIMERSIYYGLELQNPITPESVKAVIHRMAGKSREQIAEMFPRLDPDFFDYYQRAAILVYGIMKGAGIKEYYAVDSQVTDYLTTDDQYWK